MAADTLMYVILQKDLAEKDRYLPWLPPEYPARCREVFRRDGDLLVPNAAPSERHQRMTQLEVDALAQRYRREYLIGRHENNYDAKDEEQLRLALEIMPESERNALNNLAVGTSVSANLNLQDVDDRHRAMLVAYNEMQRRKRGDGEVPQPSFEELKAQIEELRSIIEGMARKPA